MRLDILCTDGSPLDVTLDTLFGRDGRIGCGGSEYAFLTLCELWSKRGDQVRVYNLTGNSHGSSPFEHLPVHAFNPEEDRDAVIIFRTPNERGVVAKGKHIWMSCDQYTSVPFSGFANRVDQTVCISTFHAQYFASTYGFSHVTVIDLPVRTWEYEERQIQKIPHQMIFNSVPDRGLHVLWRAWPNIKNSVPDATLVITSDYRLWGCDNPLNELHRVAFAGVPGVTFLGAISRDRLVDEELRASVVAYPGIYDELFCIAISECQVAGAYPVTSDTGALRTTNMGTLIHEMNGSDEKITEFADKVIEKLLDPNLSQLQNDIMQKAKARFSPEVILKQWDEKVFNG